MTLSKLRSKNWVWILLIVIGNSSCQNNNKSTEVIEKEVPYELQRVDNEHVILSSLLNYMLSEQQSFNLVDCRTAEQFAQSHLPNAINIYRDEVCIPDTAIGGLAISKDELEVILSAKGIDPLLSIVLYDDRAQCEATRLWWLLKRYGFNQVMILDGGFQEWSSTGLTLVSDSMGDVLPKSSTNFKFPNEENATILAYKNDVIDAINNKTAKLIDCRSFEEYAGETQKAGAYRAGHIPGAIHFDFWNNVNIGSDGEIWFLKEFELEKKYASIGLEKDDPIILYCQSGVRSAQSLFVLTELLGYKNVRNYDGSWIEWSADESLPIEVALNVN